MSSNEWVDSTWGDIATLEYGKSLRDYKYSKGTIPVYGTNGLIGLTDKALYNQASVIVGRKGAYRGIHFSSKPFFVIDTAFYLKPKIKDLDIKYAYYQLLTQDINAMDSGSAIPSTSREDFYQLQLSLPPLIIQQKIASILSSLDDKIELNRQTNQTLEAIAQALFKEWFVDFKFPGATGEMQESALGEIPKDWRVYRLGQLVDTISETHKFPKGKAIFLNTSDIEEGRILHNEYSDKSGLPGQAKKSIKKGDILFTEIRPANKRYALIDFDAEDFVVSTKLMVLRTIADVESVVIYNFLTSNDTLKRLQHLAESRSGTFPQITFSQVKELKVSLPNNDLLEKYETLAWSVFNQIKSSEEQIKILAELRDNLLPKLMKGEIKL